MTDTTVTEARLREMRAELERMNAEGCLTVYEMADDRGLTIDEYVDLIAHVTEALALRTPSEGEGVAKLSAAVQRLIGRGNAILGYCETPEAIEAGAAQAYTNWKREADVSMALALAALAPSPQPVAEAVAWPPAKGTKVWLQFDVTGHCSMGEPSWVGLANSEGGFSVGYPGRSTIFTSPQPEGLGIEVTDEMVERAARAMDTEAFGHEYPVMAAKHYEVRRSIAIKKCRAALTAALQPKE